jgi:hypothetical protein
MTIAPKAPAAYSKDEEDRYRSLVDRGMKTALQQGQDIELSSERLILRDTVTGDRYSIEVQSGVIVPVLI